MLPQLMNMLAWWQWLILALVPPAIVALYFLKLKRRPVEVPSTYLWHKSIEDLHVNTIWQRLRRNLLLFLQLLVIVLAAVALLRPYWRSQKLTGERFIILIDNSASMSAADVKPSRLDEAKRQAREMIDQLDPGEVAMVVSFADSARVEQMFTDNRRQLREAVDGIRPSVRGTSLLEALQVASGLANPGRSAGDIRDVQVAEPMPATVVIFSDGKFQDPTAFRLGNLEAVYKPIGSGGAENVGIVALSVRRHETKPDQLQAFARLENFGSDPCEAALELRLDGRLLDASRVQIAGGESKGVAFDLGAIDTGVLKLQASTGDDLRPDDTAWAVVNPPRRAKVLFVTPGNEPLEMALTTKAAAELAEVTVESPDFLKNEKSYCQPAAAGVFDLVIYDRCRPEVMPQANTLFLGAVPPVPGWKAGPAQKAPQILDVDVAHPLMQWIDLGDVLVARGTPLSSPPGGSVLVDTHAGPIFAIAPREQFEDAVLGLVFLDTVAGPDGKTEQYVGTNWWLRPSFPVFVYNLLRYLGGSRGATDSGSIRPGQAVDLQTAALQKPLEVRSPDGQKSTLSQARLGKHTFTATQQLGVYDVSCEGKTLERFAVNLFQPSESDIRPRQAIGIGRVKVAGKAAGWEVARSETWKYLLLLGLLVLLAEWILYSLRVSL